MIINLDVERECYVWCGAMRDVCVSFLSLVEENSILIKINPKLFRTKELHLSHGGVSETNGGEMAILSLRSFVRSFAENSQWNGCKMNVATPNSKRESVSNRKHHHQAQHQWHKKRTQKANEEQRNTEKKRIKRTKLK